MRILLALAGVLAACGEPAPELRLEAASPAYAPLAGGAVIELTGTGFSTATRVAIGGREAPLVRVVDDATLAVVTPPGSHAGDTEVVAFDAASSTSTRGIFRYSAPPAITSVAPAEVVYTSTDTTITVTGSGFLDEGAGDVLVLVDGLLVSDVRVADDRTLTFTAPPGVPLARADLQLIDARGTATLTRALRYRPSARAGLLLFPAHKEALADFYDPTDHTIITIPLVRPLPSRFTAVIRDARGDYWGLDRSLAFGRIEPRTTSLVEPRALSTLIPTMTPAGTTYYALDRIARRVSTFDPATGVVTPLGTELVPCCGSYGLAFDGAQLYVATRGPGFTGVAITPVSPQGVFGTPVPVIAPPSFHIEEMRFFRGTLYAASRDGTLVTIDPATGATTTLPVPAERYKAMEIFE